MPSAGGKQRQGNEADSSDSARVPRRQGYRRAGTSEGWAEVHHVGRDQLGRTGLCPGRCPKSSPFGSGSPLQRPPQKAPASQEGGPTADSIPAGRWLVGTEVSQGRSASASDCYYQRLSGFGGSTDEIISSRNTGRTAQS